MLARIGLFSVFVLVLQYMTAPGMSAATKCPHYDSTAKVYVACDGGVDEPTPSVSAVICADTPEIPQPADSDPAWGGRPRFPWNPSGPRADGQIVLHVCITGSDRPNRHQDRMYVELNRIDKKLSDLGVAAMAIAQLPIPSPVIGIGPDRELAAVNVPVSLWVANSAPVSASATDGPLTVTVTASISSVSWSMGEPASLDRPSLLVAPVVCTGAGTAVARGSGRVSDCSYTYQWRSLPARTGGSHEWMVTATANWAISWTSTSGRTGTDMVAIHSVTGLSVGEWRSEIVIGPTR